MRIKNVNIDIALTHIFKRKRQTAVAAFGVTLGVAVYLFMNSLSSGFSRFSRDEIFKNSAHIKIYKEDLMSQPLSSNDSKTMQVIINPQITSESKKIQNPQAILQTIKTQPYITNAIAQVSFDAFYNRGSTQIKGSGNGVNIKEYSAMFNLEKYIKAGSIKALQDNVNGVIIGSGIAEKLNLNIEDNITISSPKGITKTMKIVGIFSTGSSMSDNSKSYVNISAAQQFLKEGPAYVSTLLMNTNDADKVENEVDKLKKLTSYTVESWKTTNADVLSGDKTRTTMMIAISFTILIVAAFGIYNILSSTIVQKINDIAILKATGFNSKDVIQIFLFEALIMGIIGTFFGLIVGAILIKLMAGVYMGGPVGYFPIGIELKLFIQSFVLGLVLTICAGYFPARKAANVDPVEIFRK